MCCSMNILFVIVLYNIKLYKSTSYQSLLSGKRIDLFIYDNSPVAQHACSDFESKDNNIVYIHDPYNGGLSKAYNMAAAYAERQGYEWLLLLDQDTIFPEEILDEYARAVTHYPNIHLFAPKLVSTTGAPFSPFRYRFKTGNGVFLNPGIHNLNKYIPVNSGMMVRVRAFETVGGYNEEVFLDFSDCQFVERYRRYYDCFCLIPSVCIQNLSCKETDCQKIISRFALYCKCVRACKKYSVADHINYFFISFRHMCIVLLKTRSVSVLKIYINEYFL